MPSLKIYDSEGYEYDNDGSRRSERIEDFFFAGVRLAVEVGRKPTVTAFVRARESQSGRSEQFYAEYTTTSRTNLFESFKRAVEDRFESQLGMTLETGMDDVEIFSRLPSLPKSGPGEAFDKTLLKQLLRNGRRLRFGVDSNEQALGLTREMLDDGSANSVVIADDAESSGLNEFDLSIETGRYRGLEPIGDTVGLMNEARKKNEGQFVTETLSGIRQDMRDLQEKTSLSGREVGRKLQQESSMLPNPKKPAGATSDDSSSKRRMMAGAGVLVGLLMIVVVAIYAASFAGVAVPYGGVLPFIDGGDAITADVDGTDLTEGLTVESGMINVTGEAESSVNITWAKGGYVYNETQVSVENGSFSQTFTEVEPGTYNVSIETVDGDAEITGKVEVTESEGEEGGVETTTTTTTTTTTSVPTTTTGNTTNSTTTTLSDNETDGNETNETTTTTESSGNETNTTVLEFVEPDAVTSRNRADAASVARASFHAALATVPTARSTVLRDPSG